MADATSIFSKDDESCDNEAQMETDVAERLSGNMQA
jgi:hypothetical protein